MPPAPVNARGYARPDLLVETDWLAQHLNEAGVRIIDARQAQAYDSGHIPGALNLAAFGGLPRAANGDMGTPDEFSELAGKLGIGNETQVVVYDAPAAAMGMVAFAFLYYGHAKVQILDGGFEKWSKEGRPTSTEVPSFAASRFQSRMVEDVYCSLEHATAAHGRPNTIFWDTRSLAEYEGSAPTTPQSPPRQGHIPGAVHLEWSDLLDPEWRTFKPAAELGELLAAKGIKPETEIDCY